MAKLAKILGEREIILSEQNIREGESYVYTSAGRMNYANNFHWVSPGTGTVIIEVWGAGGSGAGRGCCSIGIPGNAGAYAKKSISVVAGCVICGQTGVGCSPTGCNPGCSQSSQVCYFGVNGNSCICSQGGKSGIAYCNSGNQPFCCYRSGGFCYTCTGNGCGIICNTCDGARIASAFGGDINTDGMVGCLWFQCCYIRPNSMIEYIPIPAGLHGRDGAMAVTRMNANNGTNAVNSAGYFEAIGATTKISKMPHPGVPYVACWQGFRACADYGRWGCFPGMPIGTGGPAFATCCYYDNSIHSIRGGSGAVRIRFIED